MGALLSSLPSGSSDPNQTSAVTEMKEAFASSVSKCVSINLFLLLFMQWREDVPQQHKGSYLQYEILRMYGIFHATTTETSVYIIFKE